MNTRVRVLRLAEAQEMTGLSRSCIYVMMGKNKFPLPVRLTDKSVGWIESEVADWILSRPREAVLPPLSLTRKEK